MLDSESTREPSASLGHRLLLDSRLHGAPAGTEQEIADALVVGDAALWDGGGDSRILLHLH